MPLGMGEIVLIYHPAYDVNHCLYRILLMLDVSIHDKFEWDLLRLMDFYFLFPHLLKTIKPFPIKLNTYRNLVNAIPEAYEVMPNSKRVLFELEAIQSTAIQNLVAKELIDSQMFKNRLIRRTDTPLPNALQSSISDDYRPNEEWFRVIINQLPQIEFFGKKGLKSRSTLMEYKYDAL